MVESRHRTTSRAIWTGCKRSLRIAGKDDLRRQLDITNRASANVGRGVVRLGDGSVSRYLGIERHRDVRRKFFRLRGYTKNAFRALEFLISGPRVILAPAISKDLAAGHLMCPI